MKMVKYNANDYIPTSFNTLVDRLFNEKLGQSENDFFIPKVDIAENEKTYELHLEAPGLNKTDFRIKINNNILTISGERKLSEEKKEANFHTIETQYGSFSRSFDLPENVASSKIEANYNNGVLELSIPKDESKSVFKTINVK